MYKFIDFFEGTLMTVISGVFLLISFILSLFNIELYFDPAWVSVVISGLPLLYSAINRLICRKGLSKISSPLLISIAMIAAITTGDLFAAGEVAFIMAIGEILEDKTTEKAKKGLKNLFLLTPKQGRLIENGIEKNIPADEIKVGHILRILPGETIPVDGEIICGETSVDQSVMTGESLPIDKTKGDSVFCGTINRFGAIDIRATNVGDDSSLSKLIKMVAEAENKKAPMQRIADKWASLLVPVALLIAIVTFIITKDITRAVTVLVVFCPCALVLATPTAIMAAIGQATKHGVIIKSGEALEKMGKADTIAFDKTGTLTYGTLSVSDIISLNSRISDNDLLSLAASAELKSEHPLGKAIVAYAKSQNLDLKEPTEFYMEAGKGVFAKLDDTLILCGNERYLTEKNIELCEKVKNHLKELSKDGKTSVIVCSDNVCTGIIALSDIIKGESISVIDALSKTGTSSILLTGDNSETADFFAKKTGISNVHSRLLPEDKVNAIRKMQDKGNTVCMIGDGINDAPALKTADVGVAMGALGSDITIDASDITLMSDDITKIPYLKRLSNETVKTIRISITLSLLINFIAIILSFTGLLTPTTGALVHNAGSVFVVLIAAFLYDRKF